MDDNRLFSPIRLRDLLLPNRVVISPMCTYSAHQGVANDWHVVHLGKFALGGAGTVFVEATAVEEDGRLSCGDLGLWNDEQVGPLARVARFLREYGAVPAIQLGHAGRKASSQRPWVGNGPLSAADLEYGDASWATVSASAVPVDTHWPTPEVLSPGRMEQMRESWKVAAARARRAGFDVIEVHMAHGYLMHQFLSSVTNLRTDNYGGSLENRMRFPLEIAAIVRGIWPQELPVFVRVSAVDDGWSIEDSVVLARACYKLGIDIIDCSTGGLGRSSGALRVSRGYGFQVPFAERIRRDAQVKTMAVGLILDPALAESIVRDDRADLVAIGREALVDPNWPLHARQALNEASKTPFETWPRQYGVWLNQRQRVLEKIADMERSNARKAD